MMDGNASQKQILSNSSLFKGQNQQNDAALDPMIFQQFSKNPYALQQYELYRQMNPMFNTNCNNMSNNPSNNNIKNSNIFNPQNSTSSIFNIANTNNTQSTNSFMASSGANLLNLSYSLFDNGLNTLQQQTHNPDKNETDNINSKNIQQNTNAGRNPTATTAGLMIDSNSNFIIGRNGIDGIQMHQTQLDQLTASQNILIQAQQQKELQQSQQIQQQQTLQQSQQLQQLQQLKLGVMKASITGLDQSGNMMYSPEKHLQNSPNQLVNAINNNNNNNNTNNNQMASSQNSLSGFPSFCQQSGVQPLQQFLGIEAQQKIMLLQHQQQQLMLMDQAKQMGNSFNILKLKPCIDLSPNKQTIPLDENINPNNGGNSNSHNGQIDFLNSIKEFRDKNGVYDRLLASMDRQDQNKDDVGSKIKQDNDKKRNFREEFQKLHSECQDYQNGIEIVRSILIKEELHDDGEGLERFQESQGRLLTCYEKVRNALKVYLEDLIWKMQLRRSMSEITGKISTEQVTRVYEQTFSFQSPESEINREITELIRWYKEQQQESIDKNDAKPGDFQMIAQSAPSMNGGMLSANMQIENTQINDDHRGNNLGWKESTQNNLSSHMLSEFLSSSSDTQFIVQEIENDNTKNTKNNNHKNPSFYIGYIDRKTGQKIGRGIITSADGTHLQAYFNNDKPNGQGLLVYSNQNTYQGQFEDGQHHGIGKYIWAKGDSYEGEFSKGKRSGRGMFKWKDGRTLDGQWVNEELNGFGEYDTLKMNTLGANSANLPRSFEIYRGNWKQSAKEGRGILYVGLQAEWKNNQLTKIYAS